MYGWRLGPSGLFTRWHRSLTVSHVGTWRDPHTPPPYWDPLFTNRHVVLSSSMPYVVNLRLFRIVVGRFALICTDKTVVEINLAE